MQRGVNSEAATTPPQESLGDWLPRRLESGRPKGQQLLEILEGLIASLKPGTPLPSERALADHFGLARMTVRNEFERLAASGLVYRVHGKGTFIADAKLIHSDALTSFSRDMQTRGMIPGGRVLSQGLVRASAIVSSSLDLPPNSTVIHIERVRTADSEPMALENAYLPAERFAGLESEDLTGRSLYRLLEERFDTVPHHARQRVSVVALDAEESALLDVPPDHRAFLIHRITRDKDDELIEYVRSLYRVDRYEIEMSLRRPTWTELRSRNR